jgi:Xaa-Pro aminopeptidase
MDYFPLRRQNLTKFLKSQSLDALVISHGPNVRYLTGFTGDSSHLVVTAKQVVLVTDARFEQQVAEEVEGVQAVVRPHTQRLPAAVGELLAKLGAKSVGLESEHATLAYEFALEKAAPKAKFTGVTGAVETLRAVKDMSEVEQIRAAIRVAERAFQMFCAMVRPEDTEKAMADALEGFVRRAGGERTAFHPIVGVGERGALPHAPPTDRTLAEGSKLLVDWGADVGYKSDLTRCMAVPGGPLPTRKNKGERTGFKFEEIYAAVLKAQEAAVKLLRDGVAAKDVDAAARAALAAAKLRDQPDYKLADRFTHGLGHGIGLEVHESPSIRADSQDTLKAGMVVTIEPGVYIPEWGGVRIEDDYLITKDGAIRLTTLPHDPKAIG